MVETEPNVVDDLFNVIGSLNLHTHYAFERIIFSDTILVYNKYEPQNDHDRNYFVMFLCEFAQDLLHRLARRNVFFRAIIDYGELTHYVINQMQCFYGQVLIDAYKKEKDIQCTGLFITNCCNKYNKIFKTARLDREVSFVYLTQGLEMLEHLYGGVYPIDGFILTETGLCWGVGFEFGVLEQIYSNFKNHPDERVREKHELSWWFYQERYPKTINLLEKYGFDLTKISSGVNWGKVKGRFPEDFSRIRE